MAALIAGKEPATLEIAGIGISFYREVRLLDSAHFLMQPIGTFYGRITHRFFIYLLQSASLLCGVFLTMFLANDLAYMISQLPLVCTLALHLVLVFTACHVICDVLANQFRPRRMAYSKRRVGQQWLVLFVGLIAGFYFHQASLPDLLGRYASRPANQAEPSLRCFAVNFSLVPLCCAALYVHYLMGLIYQHNMDLEQSPPNALGQHDLLEVTHGIMDEEVAASLKPNAAASPQSLIFKDQGLEVLISPESITHISVEDHYCRIHHVEGHAASELW